MNKNTIALLDSLGCNTSEARALRAFYANRNDDACQRGMWGSGDISGPRTIHTAIYESPNCPEGWDTFMGYLAKTEPVVAGFMDRMVEACEEDDAIMADACRAAGVKPITVLAPAWLVQEGVFEAAAYPISLLRANAGGGVAQ